MLGKTTLLGALKHQRLKSSLPTQYVNKEDGVVIGNIKFSCFDVGGHPEVRYIWEQYYTNVSGIIFVVDASDSQRIEEARTELANILSHPNVKSIPTVVLGNKIDLPSAISETDLRERLGLTEPFTYGKNGSRNRRKGDNVAPIEVFMCSIACHSGYGEALKWLADLI